MAEKEERILIARSTDYTITDTDKGARFDAKIAPHCANVFTRQEAIEKIAKAICANEDEYADCKQCEFNGPEDCKRYYRNNWLYTAEAALNALLEADK